MNGFLTYYAAREHFADLERHATASRAAKRVKEDAETEKPGKVSRRYLIRVRRVARIAH